jgi:hypothetical protein
MILLYNTLRLEYLSTRNSFLLQFTSCSPTVWLCVEAGKNVSVLWVPNQVRTTKHLWYSPSGPGFELSLCYGWHQRLRLFKYRCCVVDTSGGNGKRTGVQLARTDKAGKGYTHREDIFHGRIRHGRGLSSMHSYTIRCVEGRLPSGTTRPTPRTTRIAGQPTGSSRCGSSDRGRVMI